MSDYAVAYPAHMPLPAVLGFEPAQRVRRSDLDGPVTQAARERDFRGLARLQLVLSPAQAQEFDDWWDLQLQQGGQVFAAPWPTPAGAAASGVWRFVRPPAWAALGGGWWQVACDAELIGRYAPPQGDTNSLLGLAEWYLWADALDRAIAAWPAAGELFDNLRPWYPWAEAVDAGIAEWPRA